MPSSLLSYKGFIYCQTPGEPIMEWTAGKYSLKNGNLTFNKPFWMPLSEDAYCEMMSRSSEDEPPQLVFDTLATRFKGDLAALELLFSKGTPPVITDRVSRVLTIIYAFTDASGLGFGDTFLIKGDIE
jgi:hypothetical protein